MTKEHIVRIVGPGKRPLENPYPYRGTSINTALFTSLCKCILSGFLRPYKDKTCRTTCSSTTGLELVIIECSRDQYIPTILGTDPEASLVKVVIVLISRPVIRNWVSHIITIFQIIPLGIPGISYIKPHTPCYTLRVIIPSFLHSK